MGLVNNQLAYDRHLIWHEGAGGLYARAERIGIVFEIRIPNYRGNYLSCIESLAFTLDGAPVPEETVTVLLNGKRLRIKDFPELFNEYWDVNDRAVCEVLTPAPVCGTHMLEAVMRMRYAYSSYFGKCKVVTSRCGKTLDFGGTEGGENG